MQHNGNRVGTDPLKIGEGEYAAYGEGFKSLGPILQALMGDGD
jgi:hypothetical protein